MPLAGIDPDTVRYTNIVRCRPPRKKGGKGDDVPKADEIAQCRAYLEAEIKVVQAKTIIAVGAPALHWFLPEAKLAEVHGQRLEWQGRALVPVHHPASAAPGRNARLAQVMMADWARMAQPEPKSGLGAYTLVSGFEAAATLNAYCMAHPTDATFAFDLETDAESNQWRGTFQAHRARIIGWSFAVQEGEAFYCTDSVECIRWYLETASITKVCHNAQYETTVLAAIGIELR